MIAQSCLSSLSVSVCAKIAAEKVNSVKQDDVLIFNFLNFSVRYLGSMSSFMCS